MRSAFYALLNFINTSENDVYSNAAKIIVENITLIPGMTIVDVAQLCYVSNATISRLCRKLNYDNFAEFKMDVTMNLRYFHRDALRLEFDHQLPILHVDGKNTKELFEDHFENIIDNLRSTYESVSFSQLEFLCELLHEAREILFVGNFFTQSASIQLQIELTYLGKKCVAMYPLNIQRKLIQEAKEGDVIFLSSIAGGYWIDHPEIMRDIARSKATKVCITQVKDFPCKDMFDVVVCVGNDRKSLIGKFSITYIFEILEAIYHIRFSKETL